MLRASGSSPPRSGLSGVLERARRYLPWISLLTGVGGAVLMNRAPERAWIVVVAAVAGWMVLVVMQLTERRWRVPVRRVFGEVNIARRRRARFALLLSSQIAIQQALLFPLPFYVRAAELQPGHVVFFVVYAGALIASLWDPLFSAVMTRAPGAFTLQAFAVFVGLDMVLPVLGVSNTASFLVAGVATGVGVPALLLLELRPKTWQQRLLALPAVAVVVVAARLVAPFVPPAPLELVHVGIGTGVEERELIGEARALDVGDANELFCHSTIKAPLGLKDALVHVWRKDGRRIDSVAVSMSGGREAGFRTWSRKRSLGSSPAGTWSCSVETASGQVVGRAKIELRGKAVAPAARP